MPRRRRSPEAASGFLLSSDELVELTGYVAHRCQIRWLRNHQFPIVVDQCGRPRVARLLVLARLGFHQDANETNTMSPPVECGAFDLEALHRIKRSQAYSPPSGRTVSSRRRA